MSAVRSTGGRRIVPALALGVTAAVTLLAVLVLASRQGGGEPRGAARERRPINGVIMGTPMETTLRQRIEASDLVVIGMVGGPGSARWNTRTGALPEGATHQTVADRFLYIYTYYPVAVEQVLKGPGGVETVQVRVRGGTVGRDSITDESAARLRAGERVLLLLTRVERPDRPGQSTYGVTFGPLGKYTIEGDRAVAYDDGQELESLPLGTIRSLVRSSRPGVHWPVKLNEPHSTPTAGPAAP